MLNPTTLRSKSAGPGTPIRLMAPRAAAVLVAAVVAIAMFASAASAAQRYPVMGCTTIGSPVHVKVPVYQPYGRCSFLGRGVTDVGIYHAHWTEWGKKEASGRGSYYDGLGFLHRATMVIYRLRSRSYTRIHVRWDSVEAGALRPAGNRVFDVAVKVPAQASAAITECADYVPTSSANGTWTGYWTFNPPPGFTPVSNLTTRSVRCSNARPFSLQVSRRSRRSYHGFSCRWTNFYESYDVRCTRGREVIHWQGGV